MLVNMVVGWEIDVAEVSIESIDVVKTSLRPDGYYVR